MFSSDSAFLAHANSTLEIWADALYVMVEEDWDVELNDGILSIDLPDKRQYVINRHLANHQIWLSSPLSGAARFNASPLGWISTRQPNIILHQLLEKETLILSGKKVTLETQGTSNIKGGS